MSNKNVFLANEMEDGTDVGSEVRRHIEIDALPLHIIKDFFTKS
jgi:hypothetical protein